MNRSNKKDFHSDLMTTQITLVANERLNHINPVKMILIRKGAKTTSTNRERTPYFEFAYEFALILAAICLWPAIIFSVVTSGLFPYTFNIVSSVLYTLGGISCGWSTMFYKKKEQSIAVDDCKNPEYSVRFDKKDLFRSGIIGGLWGFVFAGLLYWFGIWVALHPRGGG